jgi:hypothetical protein
MAKACQTVAAKRIRSTTVTQLGTIGLALISPLFLAGCLVTNKTEIIQKVKDFSDSLMASKSVYAEYYKTINDAALKREEILLSLDPNCEIVQKYPSKCASLATTESSFYAPYLSSESLKLRLDLLGTLSDYAVALAQIADSKSPQDYQSNMSRISAAFSSIEGKFIREPGPRVSDYVTPLSRIAGVFGKLYLENLQWNTIQKVIEKSSPEVNVLLVNLKTDLEQAENLLDTKFGSSAKNLREYYNQTGRLTLPQSHRQDILQQLGSLTKARRLLVSSRPSASVSKLIEVNSELAKLAQSGQPTNVAQLRQLLSNYEADLLDIRDAIILLRK